MKFGNSDATSTSSWGSVFASIAGLLGSISPFLPPPYGMWAGVASGIAGAIATKLP
jgi:hypothetical protein